jgi:hypothetical protein
MYRRVSVQLRSLQPLVCKDDDDERVSTSRPFFYVGTSATVLV